MPVRQTLNRIRWDKEFSRGRFELGLFDRRSDALQRVAFEGLFFPRDAGEVFELVDSSGRFHRIPFHRVREIFRNGRIIWSRSAPSDSHQTTHSA